MQSYFKKVDSKKKGSTTGRTHDGTPCFDHFSSNKGRNKQTNEKQAVTPFDPSSKKKLTERKISVTSARRFEMSAKTKTVKRSIHGQALTEFIAMMPIVVAIVGLGGLVTLGSAARGALEAAAFLSARAQLYGHPCLP